MFTLLAGYVRGRFVDNSCALIEVVPFIKNWAESIRPEGKLVMLPLAETDFPPVEFVADKET